MRSKRSLRAACVYTAPSISTSSAQLDTCFTRPGTRTRMVPQTTSYHPTARRYSLGSIVMPRRRDPGNTLAYWMKFRRISRCMSLLMFGVTFMDPTNMKNSPKNTDSVVRTIDFMAMIPLLEGKYYVFT
uniref:Uncharacterized protein n=1 Tax=Ixodes ricinus TaxID=34613 RepID=A0A6B0UQN2_IXORI